jgi:hypothetical protein
MNISSLSIDEIFTIGNESAYTLDIILNSNNKDQMQRMFTPNQSVYDQYIHTGELGSKDIYLIDYPSKIHLIDNDFFPSYDNKKIPLGVYTHYKGNDYEVIGTALNLNTLKDDVIYSQLYSGEFKQGQTWSREFNDFFAYVKRQFNNHKIFGPRFCMALEKNN